MKPFLGSRAAWPAVMLAMAKAAALRSKDATTRVGCVIVGKDWTVLGTGFNGFTRGAPDKQLPTSGKARHLWTTHAEENSILHAVAARGSRDLSGCRAFSTHRPCSGCVRRLAHVGIQHVFYNIDELSGEQRREARIVAKILGVKVKGSRK